MPVANGTDWRLSMQKPLLYEVRSIHQMYISDYLHWWPSSLSKACDCAGDMAAGGRLRTVACFEPLLARGTAKRQHSEPPP